MALAKVKVIVLERRTKSRALTIHGRILEVFALRGIAERFLSQGRPITGFHFGGLDAACLSTLDSRFARQRPPIGSKH
jgi:2-polyprenyl-6-methoxyphenol hydroxylase-like FAD-dependent oxidoreductase